MMFLKGLRFGMLLQLAVGPVCIFIFQLAAAQGFISAEAGVLGVTLVDGLFITAAILGLTSVISRTNMKRGLKLFGAAVLFIFGANMIAGVFELSFIPSLDVTGGSDTPNAFIYTLLLTASNPLTILFWAGVFSAKLTEEHLHKSDIYIFGLGALGSTVLFLTLIAFIGSLTQVFVTPLVMEALNFAVGLSFMYFSVKMFMKKSYDS
ncbi:LysE family transporter [Paenibacillus sp. sgz500958]|uniref:LysE family transporter n=1 Tax=Paenibacillus sp. sgz500958 TaxID=3242475 RepID=UPI0036D21F20